MLPYVSLGAGIGVSKAWPTVCRTAHTHCLQTKMQFSATAPLDLGCHDNKGLIL